MERAKWLEIAPAMCDCLLMLKLACLGHRFAWLPFVSGVGDGIGAGELVEGDGEAFGVVVGYPPGWP